MNREFNTELIDENDKLYEMTLHADDFSNDMSIVKSKISKVIDKNEDDFRISSIDIIFRVRLDKPDSQFDIEL